MQSCRLIYKFIMVTLAVIVMHTGTCNAGCASDGGGEIPPPVIPDTSTGIKLQESMKPLEIQPKYRDIPIQAPVIPETVKEKSAPDEKITSTDEPVKQEPVKPDQKEPVKQPEKDFLSSFLGLLWTLAKTAFLILLILAAVLAYLHMKKRRKYTSASDEVKNREPQTVSEAVSSYVKHKLKRSA